ncbi:MAG: ABC transporter substrate-binding protein [Gammaproteobacteria bacterium]|nr:ABC transporter substrate-binding protein [Gammaproteobacteria bacterium]
MNKNILVIIGIVLLLALITGIYITAGNLQIEKEPTIRVGYLPLTANLPLFVALENGYFDEAGLSIEIKKFESSNQMIDALVTGRIDIETAASSSVTVTVAQKLAGYVKIFMLNSFTPENFLSSILVSKDSETTSVNDLAGKRIGTFPGSTMRMYTEMVLESLQVKPGEIIQLPPSTHLGALEAKSVDAVLTLEPLGTLGEVKNVARILVKGPVETNVLTPWVAGTNSFSNDFLEKHPIEAAKFKEVIYRAVDYIRANPTNAKKAMTKYTPVTNDELASRLTVPNYWKCEEIQITEFQKMADNLLNHGEINTKVDVSNLIMQE